MSRYEGKGVGRVKQAKRLKQDSKLIKQYCPSNPDHHQYNPTGSRDHDISDTEKLVLKVLGWIFAILVLGSIII